MFLSKSVRVFMLLVSFCGSASAQGTVQIAFDFTGSDPARHLPWTNTSSRADGWSTGGWTLGAGVSLEAARNDRLAFSVSSDETLSTLEHALTQQQYLSVSITTTNMGGHRISFNIRRESWFAPLRYAVRSSLDGFSENLFNSALLENADDATDEFTFLLPVQGWSELGEAVEFRIIPYATRYSGHAASLVAFRIETAAPARTLSVQSTVGGAAMVEPDRGLFEEGESIALRAVPAEGYKFAGWSGDVTGRGNPRVVVVTNDMEVVAHFAAKATPRMELGGNLEAITDYAGTWVFKDTFKMAREWLTREVGSFAWESHQQPPLDGDGWPLEIPFTAPDSTRHLVHTLVPVYEGGIHTVRFRGEGTVLLRPPGSPAVTLTNNGGPFETTVAFAEPGDSESLLLEIHASSPADPVRSIEIIAPGQMSGLAEHSFHEAFTNSLHPYRLLRFMDWLRTNGNALERWTNRTTRTHYTQARDEGIAHEYILELCNLMAKDPWICIPHAADDDYVRQVARLYRDGLDERLVLYVEYSNETWNSMPDFIQTIYVQEQADLLGISPDEFVARRSAEIFGIFAEEFGAEARHRYVNVLGAMAGFFDGVSLPRVRAINQPEHNPSHHYPDALAIAPYFGVNYTPADAPYPALEELVTTIASNSIQESIGFAVAHKQLADEQGMRLVCYEGGQHFTGIFGAENDDELTARIFALNRDLRMEGLYRDYLDGLEMAGVDMFAHFTHVSGWSKWGAWGALEYQRQSAEEAPKWRALTNWVQSIGDGNPVLRVINAQVPPTVTMELRPDRSYRLRISEDLVGWQDVPGWEDLRGDDVVGSFELPEAEDGRERLFWRFEASR